MSNKQISIFTRLHTQHMLMVVSECLLLEPARNKFEHFQFNFSTLKLVIEKHQDRFKPMNEIVASVLQINVWERDAVQ